MFSSETFAYNQMQSYFCNALYCNSVHLIKQNSREKIRELIEAVHLANGIEASLW